MGLRNAFQLTVDWGLSYGGNHTKPQWVTQHFLYLLIQILPPTSLLSSTLLLVSSLQYSKDAPKAFNCWYWLCSTGCCTLYCPAKIKLSSFFFCNTDNCFLTGNVFFSHSKFLILVMASSFTAILFMCMSWRKQRRDAVPAARRRLTENTELRVVLCLCQPYELLISWPLPQFNITLYQISLPPKFISLQS